MGHAGEVDVGDTSEDIAPVVKRDQVPAPRQRVAELEVEDGQGVAADGHERRELVRIARFEDALRAGLFKSEPAQRRRAACEESLVDRQSSLRLANYPVVVAVDDSEELAQTEPRRDGDGRAAEALRRVISMEIGEELIERFVAAEFVRGEPIIGAVEAPARRRERVVARIMREARREHAQADRALVARYFDFGNVFKVEEFGVFKDVAESKRGPFAQLSLSLNEGDDAVDAECRGCRAQRLIDEAPASERAQAVKAVVEGREGRGPFLSPGAPIGQLRLSELIIEAAAQFHRA